MSHGRRGPGRMFGEKQKTTRSTRILLGKLWKYLGSYSNLLLLSAVFILIYSIGQVVSPLLISTGLDLAVSTGTTDVDFLWILFILFMVLSFGIWVLNSANTYILAKVRANMLNDVRKDVFDRLVVADMSFHKKEQSGNITSRVTSDAEELAQGITIVTQASSQFLLIIGTFILLLVTSWIITGIALLAIPVAYLLAKFLGKFGRTMMYNVRRSYGEVSGQMAESLSGIAIAKSFNREEWTSSILYSLNLKTYNNFKKMGALFNFLFPAVSLISMILVTGTLIVGGLLHPDTLTFGQIYLGVLLVQRFLSPILHMTMYYPQLQSSLAAMDRITDVLEQKPNVMNSSNAQTINLSDTSMTFDNVSFEYVKGTPVLSNVTFKVHQGEKIAIVGHTGAGKTTLAALISRFYDPSEGRILIGNQDLCDLTLSSLHSTIGLIPQEPYLFADTVLENIRYGNPEISDTKIYELCKYIGADEFIDALADGYNTMLQESGKGLSSGQRQMITIARTLLADPKILVLDEATSRLDAYSESLVQQAQHELFKNRTTFVIAHRLTTIRDVNRIAVFEKGRLVEIGSHKELLAKKGVYSELYYTYYSHQGLEELKEVHMAPEKIETPTVTVAAPMMGGGMHGGGMSGAHGSGMGKISPDKMKEMRAQFEKMTPEQREQMQKHMASMSPEQRKKMMEQMMQNHSKSE